jgi:thiamine biosynthesis lipoprotein
MVTSIPRRFAIWLGLGLALCVMAGCKSPASGPQLKRFAYAELHMATVFRIIMYAPDETTANHAAEAAFYRVADLENIMSDYDPRSELSGLSKQPPGTPIPVSKDLFDILRKSNEIAKLSDGAFDTTIGPLVQLWRRARKTKQLPTSDEIALASQAVGYKKLKLDQHSSSVTMMVPGMRLDLGGIAKGYAADQALATLMSMGINRAMVAASGDIALGDAPPGKQGWTIAIESIDASTNSPSRTVLLTHAGISTSGDTEQYVEIGGRRYSHIVDGKTGLGLTERIGVTVIARNATTSDGLSTTLSVLGANRGLQLAETVPGVSALLVTLPMNGHKNVIQSRRMQNLHLLHQDKER